MTKAQFWILMVTSLLTGLLLLSQFLMARQLTSDSQKLAAMQMLASRGGEFSTRWKNIAIRTFQLGKDDPELKAILLRHKINVEPPKSPTPSPIPTTDLPSNPVVPSVPAFNPR